MDWLGSIWDAGCQINASPSGRVISSVRLLNFPFSILILPGLFRFTDPGAESEGAMCRGEACSPGIRQHRSQLMTSLCRGGCSGTATAKDVSEARGSGTSGGGRGVPTRQRHRGRGTWRCGARSAGQSRNQHAEVCGEVGEGPARQRHIRH